MRQKVLLLNIGQSLFLLSENTKVPSATVLLKNGKTVGIYKNDRGQVTHHS